MEEWKDINGYEGLYMISNFGRIKSLYQNRILKPKVDKNGYLEIGLMKNKRRKYFRVHRLVAIHFIPNDDEEKTEVNHIDENKENNHVENLEWCTREYNMKHGTIQQRITDSTRKTCAKRVRCVETGQEFESVGEACKQCGLKIANLSACLHGKRKTTGGYHWEFV